MNNLEKKFKEYLNSNYHGLEFKRIAHELAEIATAEIKYLDYKEVEKIFGDLNNTVDDIITAICNLAIPENKQIETMKGIIKSLEHDVRFWKDKSKGIAYKPITRDRVIEVLREWNVTVNPSESVLNRYWDCEDNITNKDKLDKLVTEILEGKEEEE